MCKIYEFDSHTILELEHSILLGLFVFVCSKFSLRFSVRFSVSISEWDRLSIVCLSNCHTVKWEWVELMVAITKPTRIIYFKHYYFDTNKFYGKVGVNVWTYDFTILRLLTKFIKQTYRINDFNCVKIKSNEIDIVMRLANTFTIILARHPKLPRLRVNYYRKCSTNHDNKYPISNSAR